MKFYNLESALQSPENVTELYIHNRSLASFPIEIFSFPNLELLDLSKNQITEIPSQIKVFQHLKTLNLEENQIQFLPKEMSDLFGLENLNLSKNAFDQFDKNIFSLKNLKNLTLSNNIISDIPGEILSLEKLECFYVENTLLQKITPSLFGLSTLREINFSNNAIRSLPAKIGRCKNLEKLNVSKCKLSKLPEQIGALSSLKKIQASKNYLKKLPATFEKLQSLTHLDLSENKFQIFSKTICQLTSLRFLFFSKNKIETLPEDFYEMKTLQVFDISNNKILFFSKNISRLQNLRHLSFKFNNLAEIPVHLVFCKNLKSVAGGPKSFIQPLVKISQSGIDDDLKIPFYQLRINNLSKIKFLSKQELFKALLFRDFIVRKNALRTIFDFHNLDLSQNPIDSNAVIGFLGKVNFSKKNMEERLFKVGIKSESEVSKNTTHIILGFFPKGFEKILNKKIVLLREEELLSWLSKNEPSIPIAQVKKIAKLLLSNNEGNLDLAVQFLKNGTIPKSLLTEIYWAHKMVSSSRLKKSLRNLMLPYLSNKSKSALRRPFSNNDFSFLENTDFDVEKIQAFVKNKKP